MELKYYYGDLDSKKYYKLKVNSKIGTVKISKEADFCKPGNLKIIKELVQSIVDYSSDIELYTKAKDIISQINEMDGTNPPQSNLVDYIY